MQHQVCLSKSFSTSFVCFGLDGARVFSALFPPGYCPQKVWLAIQKIRNALEPSLLHKEQKKNVSASNPTWGHCYHASEALYFLLGGPLGGWFALCCRDKANQSHWLLGNKTGVYLDITADQFLLQGKLPPYLEGARLKPCGFMGQRKQIDSIWGFERSPGKQAKLILENVGLTSLLRAGEHRNG